MKRQYLVKGAFYSTLFCCATTFTGKINKESYGDPNKLVMLYRLNNQIAKQKNNKTTQKQNSNEDKSRLPATTVCTFSPTGKLFGHGYHQGNLGNHKYVEIYNINNCERIRQIASNMFPRSIVFTENDNYALIRNYINRNNNIRMSVVSVYGDINWWYLVTINNLIKNVCFSSSGNTILSMCEKTVFCYNKKMGPYKPFKWNVNNGNHGLLLNEKYWVYVPSNNSFVWVCSIEENFRKIRCLSQGKTYIVQKAILNNKIDTLAIAATYSDNEYWFTKITFYDVETLKKKNEIYVPGVPYTGNRTEQHNVMQFSSDDKYLFIHTITLQDGINSWCFDVDSNNNFIRIKHDEKTSKLYELVQDKYFGTIGNGVVKIFDIRKPTQEPDPIYLPRVNDCALNPNGGALIKGIFGVQNSNKLYYYTGSTLTKNWE